MPLAERVLLVPLDGSDLPVLKFDFETADGFAQIAGDVVRAVRLIIFHSQQCTRFNTVATSMTRRNSLSLR